MKNCLLFLQERFGEKVSFGCRQEQIGLTSGYPGDDGHTGGIYDISSIYALFYYQQGDRISPLVRDQTFQIFGHMVMMQEEYDCRMLAKNGTAEDQFAYLAQHSGQLLLRDKDWIKIWRALNRGKGSFPPLLSDNKNQF